MIVLDGSPIGSKAQGRTDMSQPLGTGYFPHTNVSIVPAAELSFSFIQIL